jgi:hypothetical protein
MRSQIIPILLATVVAAVSLRGQAPAGPRPLAFDVVSVKPNTSGEQGGTSRAQPGRYQGVNVTLMRVIALAYRPVQEFTGGPDWINAARFDIETRAEGYPSQDQMLEMMRTMLADRFKLVVHKDVKEPGAALSPDSGASIFTALQEQLGLKLEPSTAPLDVIVIDSAERPSEN